MVQALPPAFLKTRGLGSVPYLLVLVFVASHAARRKRMRKGDTREWSMATMRLEGDEHGRVRKLHAAQIGPSPQFEPVPGTKFTVDADLVLLAMGFIGPVKRSGRATRSRDRCSRKRKNNLNYLTSVPGVYSVGDLRRGQSLVRAIAEGRQAAGSIDRALCAQ